MSSNPQGRCRLLELPAELRNRIYHYALVEEQIDVATTYRHGIQIIKAPGLLETCRTARSEASAIYYSLNAFWFCDTHAVTHWLRRCLNAETRLLLKVLRVANFLEDFLKGHTTLSPLQIKSFPIDLTPVVSFYYDNLGKKGVVLRGNPIRALRQVRGTGKTLMLWLNSEDIKRMGPHYAS